MITIYYKIDGGDEQVHVCANDDQATTFVTDLKKAQENFLLSFNPEFKKVLNKYGTRPWWNGKEWESDPYAVYNRRNDPANNKVSTLFRSCLKVAKENKLSIKYRLVRSQLI